MDIKDPYVSILKTIRKEGATYNPPSIEIGVVLSDNPLTIVIGDLQLTKDNIYVAEYLLKDYKRKFSIASTGATGATSNGSINSIGIPDGEINFIDGLKKGDKIVCLATENRQTYIVLAKVIRP